MKDINLTTRIIARTMGKSAMANGGIEKLNLNKKARITEKRQIVTSTTNTIHEGRLLLKKNINFFNKNKQISKAISIF